MGDLSKLLTDDRRKSIEYLHYLVTHEHKEDKSYNEVLELFYLDGKEFIEKVMEELT